MDKVIGNAVWGMIGDFSFDDGGVGSDDTGLTICMSVNQSIEVKLAPREGGELRWTLLFFLFVGFRLTNIEKRIEMRGGSIYKRERKNVTLLFDWSESEDKKETQENISFLLSNWEYRFDQIYWTISLLVP